MNEEPRSADQENQISVAAWGDQTFGPVDDPLCLVERAREEMAELADAVRGGDKNASALESADVVILLYRLAQTLEYDLESAVAEKMQINRSRLWRPKGDGTGSHIAGT